MNSPSIKSNEAEKEAILQAARAMVLSARTAPKTAGVDDVLTLITYGREKDAIADEMDKIGGKRRNKGFLRDANNVRGSYAVVLIGARTRKSMGLNCGACGHKSCREFEAAKPVSRQDFVGPACVFKALDLGIAIGSSVKTASDFNVDNRIMYRVGVAAMRLKLLAGASVVMGIPVSAKGKNIYFDRAK